MERFKIRIPSCKDSITKRGSSRFPITCPIYIECGEWFFPSQEWDDFAVVILGWWLQEVGVLERDECESAVLRFMDGPHQVNIVPVNSGRWLLAGVSEAVGREEKFREICSSEQVIKEIIRASRDLLFEIKGANTWDADCEKLEQLVNKRLVDSP
jgi:hypothetical protein